MQDHAVIVGNIGTVYSGNSAVYARRAYTTYVRLSKQPYGRETGESVTWVIDGDIHLDYVGSSARHAE